jgi:hypothetical protein
MSERCKHDMLPEQCGLCNPPSDGDLCAECNRHALRDPLSVAIGVGPVCFENNREAQDFARKLVAETEADGAWHSIQPGVGLDQSSAKLWVSAIRRLGVQARHWPNAEWGWDIVVRQEPNEPDHLRGRTQRWAGV